MSRGGDDRLIFGAIPRADLLPGELKAEAKLAAQRRALGGLVILSVILVAGGYAYATITAVASAQRLVDSNTTTTSLLNQAKEYSEVTQLQAQVKTDKAAQIVGVSTEIDWQAYLELVQGSLPAGTSIRTVSATTVAAGAEAPAPGGPLLNPSIATLNFDATTATLPDVSAWIDSLSKLPGFADALATSITQQDGGYSVTIVMHITEEALANRFIEAPPADGDTTEGTEG